MLKLGEEITLEQLQQIYSDNYIKRVCDDDYHFAPVVHPLARYHPAFVRESFCGAFLTVQFTRYEIEIHSFLFKRFVLYSRELGRLIIARCFENPAVMRLTAWVYSDLKTAANYVKKLGFRLEGVKENAVMKNGMPCDSLLYGLTRSDFMRCPT